MSGVHTKGEYVPVCLCVPGVVVSLPHCVTLRASQQGHSRAQGQKAQTSRGVASSLWHPEPALAPRRLGGDAVAGRRAAEKASW